MTAEPTTESAMSMSSEMESSPLATAVPAPITSEGAMSSMSGMAYTTPKVTAAASSTMPAEASETTVAPYKGAAAAAGGVSGVIVAGAAAFVGLALVL